MYRIVFLLLSSWFVMACAEQDSSTMQLPYYNEPDFTPVFVKNKAEVASKIEHTIGDFSFVNQDSTLISQQDIEGKIHVANFIFTSCGSHLSNHDSQSQNGKRQPQG